MVCLLRNPMVKWKNLKMAKSKFYDKKRIENIDGTSENAIWGIVTAEKEHIWSFLRHFMVCMVRKTTKFENEKQNILCC